MHLSTLTKGGGRVCAPQHINQRGWEEEGFVHLSTLTKGGGGGRVCAPQHINQRGGGRKGLCASAH